MVSNIIIDSFVLFLLIYALLDIFMSFADWLSKKLLSAEEKSIHTVIMLDKTHSIERHIQKAVKENSGYGDIIMVYKNSLGDKFKVAQKLCEKYECVLLLTQEEYLSYLQN